MLQEQKGLVPKYSIRPWASPEAAKECNRLKAIEIEYAQDEDGRLWRRIVRETFRHYSGRVFHSKTRWHIADMYAWYPGADPVTFSGIRRKNTRARPPKKVEVYMIDDRPQVFVR